MPMMSPATRSSSDARRDRAAWRDAAPALLFLTVTQGTLFWLDPRAPTSLFRSGWALSPLLAVLWLVWSQLRVLRRADEFQRVIHLEAMAVGFGVMSVGLVSVGLLHAAEMGDIARDSQAVFMVGVLAWMGVLWARTRRPG